MHLVVINCFFFLNFNSYSIASTKWAKVPFLHRHYLPLKPINRIYGWMNVFLILSSVMLTKFNIKILTFEKYFISLSYGFSTLRTCMNCTPPEHPGNIFFFWLFFFNFKTSIQNMVCKTLHHTHVLKSLIYFVGTLIGFLTISHKLC